MIVLLLRMMYSRPKKTNTPDSVDRRSLPAILQRESSLYSFVSHLLRRQRSWAAANVMTTCFRLANFHCSALWASTREFLSGNPRHGDEPTSCFGLMLLQIFMEGMLSVGLDAIPHGSNLWNDLQRQHNNLRALLGNRLDKDTWVNSRSYWRGKLIDFDTATMYNGPQVHREPPQLLQQVQAHAERHGDRYPNSCTSPVQTRFYDKMEISSCDLLVFPKLHLAKLPGKGQCLDQLG
jgi:hypothetical protein